MNNFKQHFNDTMRSDELRRVYIRLTEQYKTNEERKQIFEAYEPFLNVATEREREHARKHNLLTSY